MTSPIKFGEYPEEKFNYNQFEPELADELIKLTTENWDLVRKNLGNIVRLGRNLKRIRSVMSGAQFKEWRRCQFPISDDTLQRYQNVSKHFGPIYEQYPRLASQVALGAFYVVSTKHVPQEVRDELVIRVQRGESFDRDAAKALRNEVVAKKMKRGEETLSEMPSTKTKWEKEDEQTIWRGAVEEISRKDKVIRDCQAAILFQEGNVNEWKKRKKILEVLTLGIEMKVWCEAEDNHPPVIGDIAKLYIENIPEDMELLLYAPGNRIIDYIKERKMKAVIIKGEQSDN